MIEVIEAVRNNEERSNLKKAEVKISEKVLLSLEEAAAYTGIGVNKLRVLSESENCSWVLWNGSKRLLKRERLRDFLIKEFSI